MKTMSFIFAFFLLHQMNAQELIFNFSQDSQEWGHGFAEYWVGADSLFELDFQWTSLPAPLDTNQKSLFISGKNISDDLFMFLKRKISGLQPNTTYEIIFEVEFASKYPTNAVGVGGPPGEGVTMKAGAVLYEPDRYADTINMGTPSNPYWLMNLDKSNQIGAGTDMDTIGHVGVTDSTTVYALKTNSNAGRPFTITTDTNGEVWICVGTDSGFEATTSLYYNTITVSFHSVSTNIDDYAVSGERIVFPNPSCGNILINNAYMFSEIFIFASDGRLIEKIEKPSANLHLNLKPGLYIISANTVDRNVLHEKFIVH
jgi:hypothetical protein